mmetsp:Transcript_17346/g.23390  ORF Transcript_17346/g.23390 Transcript_17346/m.23390 type:complete len:81 (+) Transcript_17346:212-454(+)
MKVEITHDFNYVTKLKVDYSDVVSIGQKTLTEGTLFPLSYYCQTRRIHFVVGLNPEKKRFSLRLNGKIYFDLPLHLSGHV